MLYPHQVIDWDEPVPAIPVQSIAPFEAAMLEALVRARFQREPQRSATLAGYRKRAFVFYNGNAPYHYGKHQFLEIVHSLGYDTPAGVLVRPGEAGHCIGAISSLASDPTRFLKPLLGSKSWGLYRATNTDEALLFLARQRIPYLAQEYIPPEKEWRCILHRTWADIEAARMPSIRMVYEKLGPPVWGTGVARMQRLGERALWRAPESGELLRYRRLPDPAQLTKIDAFMLGLLTAYENAIGTPLATLCIDLGLTKRGPVIYEAQYPFGDPYNWLGKTGQYTAARRAFNRSLTWSGVAMRGLA